MFDDLLESNRRYAADFAHASLDAPPRRRLALLTCIDSRIDPLAVLGLEPGDAKVVRNAGGRATDDALRSIAVAAAVLNVENVIVMHHTECAMTRASNEEIAEAVAAAGGAPDGIDFLAVPDPEAALRQDVETVRSSLLVPPSVSVVGWMYDVRTGIVEPSLE